MSNAFFDRTTEEISARIREAASVAAGEPVVVHVSREAYGFRNIGVELPKRRRSAQETRLLRTRMGAALAELRVVLADHALVPKVPGDLLGQVQVRAIVPSSGDASHLYAPTPSGDGERARTRKPT